MRWQVYTKYKDDIYKATILIAFFIVDLISKIRELCPGPPHSAVRRRRRSVHPRERRYSDLPQCFAFMVTRQSPRRKHSKDRDHEISERRQTGQK